MPRVEANREVVQRLMRAAPFRPFALNMENGDRILVTHPENIAFDAAATEGGRSWDDFHVISGGLWYFTNFSAITTVVQLDRGQPAE